MRPPTKVVLVDDNEDRCRLMHRMLSELPGHRYDIALLPSGHDTQIRLVGEKSPGICLLGHDGTADDSVALMAKIVRSGFDGPILILTSGDEPEIEAAVLIAGAADCLNVQRLDAAALDRSLRTSLLRKEAAALARGSIEARIASPDRPGFLVQLDHALRTPLAALLGYANLLALDRSQSEATDYVDAILRNGRMLKTLLDDMVDLRPAGSDRFAIDAGADRRDGGSAKQVDLPGARVVIVDDVADIRDAMARLLESVGLTVTLLNSGEALLRLFDAPDPIPDLVLLDMQMPVMDGYEVARRMRERGIDSPIIAISADSEASRERCIRAGCVDFMSKPIEPAALFGCIRYWLAAKRNTGSSGLREPAAATETQKSAADVLVVDDARDGREAMRELLDIAGFEVCTAGTEDEAAAALATAHPRSVILDLNLGAGSGLSLARTIRGDDRHRRMAILGLSGRAPESLPAGERELFDAYMTKPVDMSEILQTLAACGIEPTSGSPGRFKA